MCPGGEGAVLKTVGPKGLAGSNPVHGVYARLIQWQKLRLIREESMVRFHYLALIGDSYIG